MLHCGCRMHAGTRGIGELKGHAFFKGIDWESIYLEPAAYQPEILHELDTQNFESFDDSPISETAPSGTADSKQPAMQEETSRAEGPGGLGRSVQQQGAGSVFHSGGKQARRRAAHSHLDAFKDPNFIGYTFKNFQVVDGVLYRQGQPVSFPDQPRSHHATPAAVACSEQDRHLGGDGRNAAALQHPQQRLSEPVPIPGKPRSEHRHAKMTEEPGSTPYSGDPGSSSHGGCSPPSSTPVAESPLYSPVTGAAADGGRFLCDYEYQGGGTTCRAATGLGPARSCRLGCNNQPTQLPEQEEDARFKSSRADPMPDHGCTPPRGRCDEDDVSVRDVISSLQRSFR
eukprot:scaffold3352_cov326-Prasinococcus_capsulatus_cf.AAC.10